MTCARHWHRCLNGQFLRSVGFRLSKYRCVARAHTLSINADGCEGLSWMGIMFVRTALTMKAFRGYLYPYTKGLRSLRLMVRILSIIGQIEIRKILYITFLQGRGCNRRGEVWLSIILKRKIGRRNIEAFPYLGSEIIPNLTKASLGEVRSSRQMLSVSCELSRLRTIVI